MKPQIELSAEQKQLLSASQIQSLSVLAMDTTELHDFLQNEYLENPLLDHVPGEGVLKSQTLDSICEAPPPVFSEEDWENDAPARSVPAPEPDAVKNSLLWQLERGRYDDRQWRLMEHMIEDMDEQGYYSLSAAEAAGAEGVPEELAAAGLAELRELEPCGIMAQDLRSCLLKQLEKSGQKDTPVWKIVEGYLEDAAGGRINVISRALGLSTAEVRKCLAEIRRLHPRPLLSVGRGPDSYVVPDILVTRDGDFWQIELNDAWVENYQVNDYYLSMMKDTKDPELLTYFQEKLKRLRAVQQNIGKRRDTLLTLTRLVLEAQDAYFRSGQPLVPMTVSDLAGRMDVHPSTVSRAIHGKYLQYPGGTVLLKSLFTQAADRKSGGDGAGASVMDVKQAIRRLVDQEDKRKPRSDQELTRLLGESGVQISRRAVAKYRDEMGIPGSTVRKAE